jgi:HPr kinase/phosphorylase
VVDLGASDAQRMPLPEAREIVLEGISLPRLGILPEADPLPLVLAAMTIPDPGF